MVTSNAIDKVRPVARTEERKHVGRMGRKEGPRAARACGPLVSSQTKPFAPVPKPAQPHRPLLLNHPPMAVSQPHLTSFLAARSQGPRAGATQGPNEVGSVGVFHSYQGWRKGPHTVRLLPPLALGTSPEPREVPL